MKLYKTLNIVFYNVEKININEFIETIKIDDLYLSWKHEKTLESHKSQISIEIIEYEKDARFDEINEFTTLIKKHRDIICPENEIGLSLFLGFEYDEQCALEFNPQDLDRLSELNIALCINCWQDSSFSKHI